MTTTESGQRGTSPVRPVRYHSGPLAWCLILGGTCLLLFLFQKILWLVVPFLFGLIIYYLLFPLQQRLVLGGMTRDAASALVSGAVFALAASTSAVTWVADRMISACAPFTRSRSDSGVQSSWMSTS